MDIGAEEDKFLSHMAPMNISSYIPRFPEQHNYNYVPRGTEVIFIGEPRKIRFFLKKFIYLVFLPAIYNQGN
jgi:hypothetical protein